jgi:CheY-like chemotaxis protein
MTTAPLADLAPKVLVADPDVESHPLYAYALGLGESDITHVTDGRDALVKVLEYPFALVITETQLPFIDGYALCELIRNDPATRTIPIMVVTSDSRPASLKRALQAGADVALGKPWSPEDVLSEARRLLLGSHELRDRSNRVWPRLAAQREKSPSMPDPGHASTRTNSRRHRRYETTQPSIAPPALRCPECDGSLQYKYSQVGGVSARDPEQWDYYTCSTQCGRFQYRQRTRMLRPV